MDASTLINIIILALFGVALLAILVYTIMTSRPDPRRRPRGPEAIDEAIDRWDRRSQTLWWSDAPPADSPLLPRRLRRPRRRHQNRED